MVKHAWCLLLAGCLGDADPYVPPEPQCPTPYAAVPPFVAAGTAIDFGEVVEVAVGTDPAILPDRWDPMDSFVVPDHDIVLFARAPGASDDCVFRTRVSVVSAFPTSGVSADDDAIDGWADKAADVTLGSDNDPGVDDPKRALGAATGDPYDTASLGNGGSLTLRFDPPIRDGDGDDFAVFENGFTEQFLELAFVEVSTDGETFVRFPTLALNMQPVSAYGTLDPSTVFGVAGRFKVGVGTPFDLADLAFTPEARAATLDLGRVRFVRVVDIIGDGSMSDSFGNPIYDPFPVHGTAGFDLEAIAVLND